MNQDRIKIEVLERFISLCKEFAAGNYDRVNELLDLTKEKEHPELLSELAESFGMMII